MEFIKQNCNLVFIGRASACVEGKSPIKSSTLRCNCEESVPSKQYLIILPFGTDDYAKIRANIGVKSLGDLGYRFHQFARRTRAGKDMPNRR